MSCARLVPSILVAVVVACTPPVDDDQGATTENGVSTTAGAEPVVEKVADGLPRGLTMAIAGGTLHAAFVQRDGAADRVFHLQRAASAATPFVVEVVATASDTALEGTGLAIDPTGAPHVAYFDRGKILVAKKVGGAWSSELVENDAGRSLINPRPRIAIGSDGVEHVVYNAFASAPDGRNRGALKYAVRSGASFATQVVDFGVVEPGWVADSTGNASLALDSSDAPHVCYELSRSIPAVSSLADLFYAKRVGGAFVPELAERGGRRGGSCSIALGADGSPVISHLDWGVYDLHVTKKGAAGWTTAVVDSAGAVGRFSSLTLESSGSARVAYVDETSGMLKRARASGATGWTVGDVLMAHAFAGGDMVSALQANGDEHFLFTRIGASGRGELVYVKSAP